MTIATRSRTGQSSSRTGSRAQLFGSTSAKYGSRPQRSAAIAVAAKVNDGMSGNQRVACVGFTLAKIAAMRASSAGAGR